MLETAPRNSRGEEELNKIELILIDGGSQKGTTFLINILFPSMTTANCVHCPPPFHPHLAQSSCSSGREEMDEGFQSAGTILHWHPETRENAWSTPFLEELSTQTRGMSKLSNLLPPSLFTHRSPVEITWLPF